MQARSSQEDESRAWQALLTEQQQLMEKVNNQATEIEQMQAHINVFQKKTTNINAAI